ncbi:hypothetical protein N7G274_002533 [Stereocaulon virgatum]|uniref:Uncharacterized protein n=1 Tax=Stereocaulon virgatum TaxID=373712 RepID=A0ABR4AG34_9LECA
MLVSLHLFTGNDDSVGGVAGGGAAVFNAVLLGHLRADAAPDTVGCDEHVALDPLSRSQLNSSFEMKVGLSDFMVEANVDVLCVESLEEDTLQVPSVYH